MDMYAILLPLGSMFVGAVITYYVNTLLRRRTYVDDLFNAAIAAVSAAAASVDYLASTGRPMHLTDDEFAALQKWLVTEGLKNWATRVAEANEALARVLPFQPALADLMPYSPDANHRDATKPVIEALRRGPARPNR